MNAVAITCRGIPAPSWTEAAAAFAAKAIEAAGFSAWDLSLVLCGDPFIAELNETYRHKEGPTDVLSFEMGEWYEGEEGRRYMAGDVVICLDALRRNAADFSVGEDEELKRLIVHGILHLSGLDHETNDATEPMLARQEELLRSMSEERIL